MSIWNVLFTISLVLLVIYLCISHFKNLPK